MENAIKRLKQLHISALKSISVSEWIKLIGLNGILIAFALFLRISLYYIVILAGLCAVLLIYFAYCELRWTLLESEYYQLTDFLQQFIVCFKQHPKIFASLNEVFPVLKGKLKTDISLWIHQLNLGVDAKEAMQAFLSEYPHFIIGNLFHLTLAVERFGGTQYLAALDLIQEDIEDWIEDTLLFKQTQSRLRHKLQILCLFSCVIALMSHNMLFKTQLVASLGYYEISLVVFLGLVMLTLFFSQKILVEEWIDESELIWKRL